MNDSKHERTVLEDMYLILGLNDIYKNIPELKELMSGNNLKSENVIISIAQNLNNPISSLKAEALVNNLFEKEPLSKGLRKRIMTMMSFLNEINKHKDLSNLFFKRERTLIELMLIQRNNEILPKEKYSNMWITLKNRYDGNFELESLFYSAVLIARVDGDIRD